MGQSTNDPQLLLKFPDGKTATQSQSAYQADPLVEVTDATGTQIIPESQFMARLDTFQGQIAAAIGDTYLAGRRLESQQSAVAHIGDQVQAALSSLLSSGALGSFTSAKPCRDEPGQRHGLVVGEIMHQVQEAAWALQQGFEVMSHNMGEFGTGLIDSSSKLHELEQANVAPYGRTATDPRPGLNKILAMGARGE